MKPNTNSTANGKKNIKSINKGFGFADAMFGIKDIAMEYQNLQAGPVMPMKMPVKIEQKPPTKVTVLKKQPIVNTKIQSNDHQTSKNISLQNNQKQTFKVSAGKQFDNFTLHQLKIVKTNEDIYELTLDGKQTHWQYNIFCDGIQANMIVPQPQISFNFQATDVKQGGLGNCYFIATIASLAHLPYLLRQRIPKFKSYSAKDKTYEVNIFESGNNIKILVDNLFPKIFAKPVGNDISLMVLQKAYAQAYGNFQVTNMGHACDSLRDMTGAPTQYIDIKDKEKLIIDVQEAFQKEYPIVIASKVATKLNYLSGKHSFNVLDYKITKGNLYLKFRDPRGCDCSHFPQTLPISPQQSSNGIFWVDYKTLIDNFQVITISRVKQQNKYFYKTFKSKQLTNNQAVMLIKVKQRSQCTFTVHQKHKKFFDQKFTYKMCGILLAKIEQNHGKIIPIKTIASEFKAQQICSITADIDQGQYLIFAKIGQPNYKPKLQNQALTISMYSSLKDIKNIQCSSVKGNLPVQQFLQNYIINNITEFKQSISDQKLYRYFGVLYGYLCMYYQNRSTKSVIQQLEYNTENITISESKISLGPGQSKIIMHPIGQANNCSHKFAFKTKTMYKS